MDMTALIEEAYERAPANVIYYDTLEISDNVVGHDPILIVRSMRRITTNQGTFQPVMFDFALPGTEGGVSAEMTATIEGVTSEARQYIRAAAMSTTPVSVHYRQYISTDPNNDPADWDPDVDVTTPIQVKEIKETMNGIEAMASFPDLVNKPFGRLLMSAILFPGMRA